MANLSVSVAAALSEGLEQFANRTSSLVINKESVPVLEAFINATTVLVESAGNNKPPLIVLSSNQSINYNNNTPPSVDDESNNLAPPPTQDH